MQPRLFQIRPFVSEGVAKITETTLGFKRAFLVQDPDSHVLRIVQP